MLHPRLVQVRRSGSRSLHSALLGGCVLLQFVVCLPSRADVPEFRTDRPDFTETSFVVGPRVLQFESGFTWTDEADRSARTLNLSEFLLRYGVGPCTELRVGLPDFIHSTGGGRRSSLLGDTYLGAKQQLLPSNGRYGLSLIPAISVPTGSGDASSGAVDPELVITWSVDLTDRWSLGGILGNAWVHQQGGRRHHFFPTVALGTSLTDRIGTFVEWAATFEAGGPESHLFHHGYTYALSPSSQLDLHLGVGLSSTAPDFFVGMGYSARYW